jgi:hypothetical protein
MLGYVSCANVYCLMRYQGADAVLAWDPWACLTAMRGAACKRYAGSICRLQCQQRWVHYTECITPTALLPALLPDATHCCPAGLGHMVHRALRPPACCSSRLSSSSSTAGGLRPPQQAGSTHHSSTTGHSAARRLPHSPAAALVEAALLWRHTGRERSCRPSSRQPQQQPQHSRQPQQ